MQSDFYAKITNADGESKKKGKENQIEVLSWAWGVSNASGAGRGSGSGKGQAVAQDLSFTHNYDKSSPNLAKFCAAGDHIKELKLTARKAGGEAADYIIITLTEAFITSVSLGGSGGGDVVETVSCSGKEIKFEYFTQDDKGGVKAGPLLTWNLETGEAKN